MPLRLSRGPKTFEIMGQNMCVCMHVHVLMGTWACEERVLLLS